MDSDGNDSHGHNHSLAGEGNSKSSPVLHPYGLPKFDFDDSLPGQLRYDNLAENEVFLGISSEEHSQWMEDFSRGNSGIGFSSGATETCSISRCNNVWSEATSSESVAMLLKSVGQEQEERIQVETMIEESDNVNEFGRLSTEMELKQDDKLEDVTNSQSTALPDSFPDGNVNAVESQNDNPPANASFIDISNVSTRVIVSEADVGSERTYDDANHLERSQLDNVKRSSSEVHIQNVTLSQCVSASSSELNGQEDEHCVNLISVQTGVATCTDDVENPLHVVSSFESLDQKKAESNITSFDESLNMQGKVTCNLQIEEVCKNEKGSVGPSQQTNVEVGVCDREKICNPLQDSPCDSSVACLDDMDLEEHPSEAVNEKSGKYACTELENSIVDEKENSCRSQMVSLESQNVDVVDTNTGIISCPEHYIDSFVKNEKIENHLSGGASAEASLFTDVDHRLAKQGEGSCNKHVENHEKQLSTEDVLEGDNTPEAQISCHTLIGHVQPSKNNLSSEQDGINGYEKDAALHERGDAKSPSPSASFCPDDSSKTNLAHGSEVVKSTYNGPGSEVVAEELQLSSCDTPNGLPLLSGSNTTADGGTLFEEGQNSPVTEGLTDLSQVTTDLEPSSLPESAQEELQVSSCDTSNGLPLLSGSNTTADGGTLFEKGQNSPVTEGLTDLSQVTTDLEPSSLPESAQASRMEEAAVVRSSTQVEVSHVLSGSETELVDATVPATCKSHEEIIMDRNVEVADVVLLSSQIVVPAESVSVSMVKPCTVIQKDHGVIITSLTQLTGIPSTTVDPAKDNQASFALACSSECVVEYANKDEDVSDNTFKENLYPPSVISCEKIPLDETGQRLMTQSVTLHINQDDSNKRNNTTGGSCTGLSETENNTKDLQLDPTIQIHQNLINVKGCPVEGNLDPPSVSGCCADNSLGENGQHVRTEEASVGTVQHFEATPDAVGKVQSAASHVQHDDSNAGKNINNDITSPTDISEREINMDSEPYPSINIHTKLTDVKGCPLASDSAENCHEDTPGHLPMLGKKRACAKGTSERRTRPGSVKASAKEKAKKREVQETPVKQFEGDKSTMCFDSSGTGQLVQFEELNPSSNAEQSGAKGRGVLPIPISNIPDLNTSGSYIQKPFTDLQQVQLRAQILVHGSLMQNSVPDEACMISAFGPSDVGRNLWEPAWRACSERIHTQKSLASNLETPARSCSGSRGLDQPAKNSSLQSKTSLPAGRASSKGVPSPVVNSMLPQSSPLWNVSPCDGLQSSGTFVDYLQPLAPLQPYQAQVTRGFVEQNPSWLSQSHFPGQWMASPQTSALDVNGRGTLTSCSEPLKLPPAKVASVSNLPATKQATDLFVSTGGGNEGAGVHSSTSFQTDANKTTVPSGQKQKRKKKVPDGLSPGNIPLLNFDQAATAPVSDALVSGKAAAPQAVFQKSLLSQNLPETASSVVNNVTSISTTANFVSTSHSSSHLAAVSPIHISDQITRMDQIFEKKSLVSEDTLNEVEAAKLLAEAAATHAAAAVGNCNYVWNQLIKLQSSGLGSDDQRKLSSAAMAIAAAASVAKAAAAAAKLASNVAVEAKLMADEVSTTSVVKNNSQSTGISLSRASNSSLMAGEGNYSASSIIAAAKETVKKRVEAATAASKHAENLDAIVKAAELAAEAVSEAGKIVSIGDPLPFSELVGCGPKDYWRTPKVSCEQGAKTCIDQETCNPKSCFPAEPPKVGTPITREIVNRGAVSSIGNNSSRTKRGQRALETAHDSNCNTISEAVTSEDAHNTASGISSENKIVEGSVVEVFKGGGNCKAAWYTAEILNLKDGQAFVCYSDLQSDEGSGKLKEWVPLICDGSKAPTIRIPHPTTGMCFDGTRKRRRAAVMNYTWCVGDRVDAWMQDCWLEGVVRETDKNDETTLTIYVPALGGTFAMKTWHLRPTLTWRDGKWIECPTANRQSASQGDTPQEKRAKLGPPAIEVADKISRGVDFVESKEHEELRPLPLSANEKEFNIGNNSKDNKLDAQRTVRTGLPKEVSRVVFGVPKPGKKRKFMDVSKHLDSDQSGKSTNPSDSMKSTRNLPQASGRSWNNNTNVDIKEKRTENKPKVPRLGKSQSVTGRSQKINSSVSAKSTKKVISNEDNNSSQQDLMEFGSVSDSQDTSEGPSLVPSKGLPKVSHKRVASSNTKPAQLNKGKRAAAGGEFGKKVEQDESSQQAAAPRRSNRKFQPTSRLLEGLQSSMIISKMPSVPHEKNQRTLNKGNGNHG